MSSDPGRGMLELVRSALSQDQLHLAEEAERELFERFSAGVWRIVEEDLSTDDMGIDESLQVVTAALRDVARERNVQLVDASVVAAMWDRICPLFPFC